MACFALTAANVSASRICIMKNAYAAFVFVYISESSSLIICKEIFKCSTRVLSSNHALNSTILSEHRVYAFHDSIMNYNLGPKQLIKIIMKREKKETRKANILFTNGLIVKILLLYILYWPFDFEEKTL